MPDASRLVINLSLLPHKPFQIDGGKIRKRHCAVWNGERRDRDRQLG
jgi:hypothetical protein